MDWRKQQRPATFRGVPFFVWEGERTGGRDAVIHDYPFNESPAFSEDLGRKSRTFTVEGHVIGDEYTTDRDALLDALEKPGSGELVHPHFGVRRVVVGPGPFHMRESMQEGGIARFTIEFTETTVAPPEPKVTAQSAATVITSAASAVDAAQTQFLADFKAAQASVGAVSGVLRAFTGQVDAALTRIGDGVQTLATLRTKIDGAASSANALAGVPADLYLTAHGLVDSLAAAVVAASVPNPARVLAGIYFFPAPPAPSGTAPSQAQTLINYNATLALVRRLALAKSAELLPVESFVSYEDAVTERAIVTDAIDAHLDAVADGAYPAFAQLRSDLVLAVPGFASDLPHLQEYTPPTMIPSLVLAHQLYGDIDHELELVARNAIVNPGFVLAGVPLEVLTRE